MKSSVRNRNARQAIWGAFRTCVFGAILTVFLASSLMFAQEAPQTPGVSPEQAKRIEVMKSRGPEASLTILPVGLVTDGKPMDPPDQRVRDLRDRVTEVVGLFLEKMGLKTIELGKTAFNPAAKADMADLAITLAEFVKQHPITTEYVLYAEGVVGAEGMRAILADKTGAVVWSDRLTAQDEPFKSGTPEPMVACELLVKRLSPQLGLNEETRKAAKPGKIAAIMAERSGEPPENETAPLPGRQKDMKNGMPNATLVVFSVRARVADNAPEAAHATGLVKMINDEGLFKAEPAKQPLLLKSSQADPNEMKIMWDLAREFRDYLRKNPMDADYVLYADYRFNPQNWQQGFVHFIVCDRKGEWVFAELVNSHFPAYQSIKPTSKEDCDKVLVRRLKVCLK
jgi:hypothetical protein